MHAKHGGWFAIRGVIIFKDVLAPNLLRYINASVNSSGAHPPPGQPPGISIFFFKWQIPGGGDK